MTRFVFALLSGAALALAPSLAAAAGPLQRFALVVGANSGGVTRRQLEYAIADAERFARVMVDLGGVDAANEIVLRQPKLRDLVDALDTLARRVTEARRVTVAAGGRTEIVRDARDLTVATEGIADELSKQYYLGYPSLGKKDGRWHTIRVELRNNNARTYRIRARRGYVAS